MTAGPIDQIPRNALALLMAAQVAVLLPHAAQLSVWILAVCAVCVAWRAMVHQGRWGFPPGWVKVGLVVCAIAALAVDGGGRFSVESASALLILAFALKLVEMRTRRDAYLVVFLCYFVIATEFLFSQTMLAAAYEVFAAVVVTAAMISLNQLQTKVRPGLSLRLAASLLAQALPLTLVLFLFFPRIAPLWNVPVPNGAKTGITDSVTPGQIAKLSQSDELAFRVVFLEDPPPKKDLYWRGVVYDLYDKGTWREGPSARPVRGQVSRPPAPQADSLRYTVMQEPTFASYLFALPTARSAEPNVVPRVNETLLAKEPVMALERYEVTSYLNVPPGAADARDGDAPIVRPARDNPLMTEWARRTRARAGSDERFIEEVLQRIRAEFTYTLQPPTLPLGGGDIDAFWFDTKAGFCSHFAGAFVYAMRAAGIPARMIGGYQGGQVNPISGHLIVRQFDAHAWAEVWVDDYGWQRVDPTGAVAPERIEAGLSAALSDEDRSTLSLFSTTRLGNYGAFERALYMLDSVQHRWNLWVVGYDGVLQDSYLERLFGEKPSRLLVGSAILIGGALSLGIAGLALYLRRPRRRTRPALRAFLKFAHSLARRGHARDPSESPMAFVERVAHRFQLPSAEAAAVVAGLDSLLYNPAEQADDAATRRRMRNEERALARKLRKLRLRTLLKT